MRIVFPHKPGIGGPGSFQSRFEAEIRRRGWKVGYASSDCGDAHCVFVVGGTKRLFWLLKMKLRRVPIIYRLDGISWLHRRKKVSIVAYLLAEYRNFNNKLIHAFFADHVVYQSLFVKHWWERQGWRRRILCSVIHNGVDLEVFRPHYHLHRDIAIVCMEGTIDYSPYAVEVLNILAQRLGGSVPLRVYGRFEKAANIAKLDRGVVYLGPVEGHKVPHIFNGSIYFSLDVNPACPNTVIEALACGVPVVAFDTGALNELVPSKCGVVVPYGSDPWALETPDVEALIEAINGIRRSYDEYSEAARQHAVATFDIKVVFERYLAVFKAANMIVEV